MKNEEYRKIKGHLRQKGELTLPPPGRLIMSRKELSLRIRPKMDKIMEDLGRNG